MVAGQRGLRRYYIVMYLTNENKTPYLNPLRDSSKLSCCSLKRSEIQGHLPAVTIEPDGVSSVCQNKSRATFTYFANRGKRTTLDYLPQYFFSEADTERKTHRTSHPTYVQKYCLNDTERQRPHTKTATVFQSPLMKKIPRFPL